MVNAIQWSPGVTLEIVEKQVILAALSHYKNNKTQTAQSLGIAIRTLDNKLDKYREEGAEHERRQAERTAKRQQWLEDQRGNATQSPARNIEEFSSPGTDSQTGLRMEPASQVSEEQSVPLPVGSKVQKVPPRSASKSRRGKRSR